MLPPWIIIFNISDSRGVPYGSSVYAVQFPFVCTSVVSWVAFVLSLYVLQLSFFSVHLKTALRLWRFNGIFTSTFRQLRIIHNNVSSVAYLCVFIFIDNRNKQISCV